MKVNFYNKLLQICCLFTYSTIFLYLFSNKILNYLDLTHHLDAIARKGILPEGTAEESSSDAARKNLNVSAVFSKSLDTLNEDKKYPMKAKSVEELHVTQQALPANYEDRINRRNKHTAVSVDNINLALANTKDMFKLRQKKAKSVPAVHYSEEVEV